MNNEPSTTLQNPDKLPEIHVSASIDEVLEAFHGVRAAVADLFVNVGADPTKTRESARLLGLNRGLAWRLTRVVRSSDDPAVVSDVPGRQSMGKFIDACRQRGAPESTLAAARKAMDAFESAVDSCSGDRKTLAMLMANRDGRMPSSEQEKARRKLFEGACAIWGVQAQMRFVTVFVYPADDDPTQLNAGHITGFIGFRRLSPRPWPMSYEVVQDETGKVLPFKKEPLDPSGSEEGELQLLTEFCDPPRPNIETRISNGYKAFELASGPVGNEGLTTCIFGSHLSHLFNRYSDTPDTAGFNVILNTPIERVIFDMFVHKDLGVPDPPRAQLLDRLTFPHGNVEAEFDRQSLSIQERATQLPGGVAGAISPYIPAYPRILSFASDRIGHAFEEFEGSRFEMAYPPISTMLGRRFDLDPTP